MAGGKQKYRYFTVMKTGDPILFYSDGEFFASCRVGVTLQDTELGEKIWDSPESKCTRSIYCGILRMTDFVTRVPNLTVEMNIVVLNRTPMLFGRR